MSLGLEKLSRDGRVTIERDKRRDSLVSDSIFTISAYMLLIDKFFVWYLIKCRYVNSMFYVLS
jgi:hypothetical protein